MLAEKGPISWDFLGSGTSDFFYFWNGQWVVTRVTVLVLGCTSCINMLRILYCEEFWIQNEVKENGLNFSGWVGGVEDCLCVKLGLKCEGSRNAVGRSCLFFFPLPSPILEDPSPLAHIQTYPIEEHLPWLQGVEKFRNNLCLVHFKSSTSLFQFVN